MLLLLLQGIIHFTNVNIQYEHMPFTYAQAATRLLQTY